jgi:type VI secretion system protein ImpC
MSIETDPQSAAAAAQYADSSLLDQIMETTRLRPSDEGYDLAKRGIEAFISELVKPTNQGEKVNNAVVDRMIAEIDAKLGKQLDAILHDEQFQTLESAWRGLKFLVDRTNFRENVKIEVLSASKQDLLEDFEDAPEISKSGLYKQVYVSEYGQFGGQPIGAVITNFEFSPGVTDIKLMQDMSAVGAMSHAPVIAAAGPQFFGADNFDALPNLKDLQSIFDSPTYARWNTFRESADSRYLGLTLPRFMLRVPYGKSGTPVKSFNYEETAAGDSKNYLWGNTAFAMATRLSESFASYRWCPNIVGPQSGGLVEDLPLSHYEATGQTETKIPTEVLVSDRREYELAEQGFIALTMRKGSSNAAFFSANSVQKPKTFGNNKEGKQAELNYKLGTQLPYLFIVNRLAHYIKVLQRENIGSWKQRGELETELNNWIRQYVSDQDNPTAEVRSRRPLRRANIKVEDVEGEVGWYKVNMEVQPHFKHMGADFTLSLTGKLDKA